MGEQLTPEELADMETGLTDGTIVYGRVLRRLITALRAAWAERDEARGHVVWWHGEWCKASDEITRLRAAAPVPTGWVPVGPDGEPMWGAAAPSEDAAWRKLWDARVPRSAGYRVVPCAALANTTEAPDHA